MCGALKGLILEDGVAIYHPIRRYNFPKGSKGAQISHPLLRQDNCTLNPNWYVAKCDVPQ